MTRNGQKLFVYVSFSFQNTTQTNSPFYLVINQNNKKLLLAKKPGLAVYGADARIPEINYVCKDHEEFKLGSLEITPLHTPCHTKGHVCYYVVDPATNEKAVFTGE